MGSPSDSSFPGFRELFELGDPGSDRAFVADINLSAEEATELLRADTLPTKPLEAAWAMGTGRPGDVVWTTLALPVLMSQRVVSLLETAQATGWRVFPVSVRDKGGESHQYYFLSVSGRCGPIDDSKSEKREKEYPGGRFPVWKGLYFSPTSWDGSDLFMSEQHSGWVFASRKVVDALKKGNVKNLSVKRLDEIERERLTV